MGTRLGARSRAAAAAEPAPASRAVSPAVARYGAEKDQPHREQPGRGQEIASRDPPRGRARRSARGRAPRQARVPRRPSKSTVASIGDDEGRHARRHAAFGHHETAARRTQEQAPPIGTGGQRREAPQRREVHGEDVRVPLPVSAPKPTMPASVTAVQASAEAGDAGGHRGVRKDDLEPDEEEQERGGLGHTPARAGYGPPQRETPAAPVGGEPARRPRRTGCARDRAPARHCRCRPPPARAPPTR